MKRVSGNFLSYGFPEIREGEKPETLYLFGSVANGRLVFHFASLYFSPCTTLFSSVRAARRKPCQWHMACHCAKHPY